MAKITETIIGTLGTAYHYKNMVTSSGRVEWVTWWQIDYADGKNTNLQENSSNAISTRELVIEMINGPIESLVNENLQPPENEIGWHLVSDDWSNNIQDWAILAQDEKKGPFKTFNRQGGQFLDGGETLLIQAYFEDTISGWKPIFKNNLQLDIKENYRLDCQLYLRKATDNKIYNEGSINFYLEGNSTLSLNPINYDIVKARYKNSFSSLPFFKVGGSGENISFEDWIESEEKGYWNRRTDSFSGTNQFFGSIRRDDHNNWMQGYALQTAEMQFYLQVISVEKYGEIKPNTGQVSSDGMFQWNGLEWMYIGPVLVENEVIVVNDDTGEEETVIEEEIVIETPPLPEPDSDEWTPRESALDDEPDESTYVHSEADGEEDSDEWKNEGSDFVQEDGGTEQGTGNMEVDDMNFDDEKDKDDWEEQEEAGSDPFPESLPKSERDWGKIFIGIAVIGGLGFLVYFLLSKTKKTDSVQVGKKSTSKTSDSVQVGSSVAQNTPEVSTNVEVNIDG